MLLFWFELLLGMCSYLSVNIGELTCGVFVSLAHLKSFNSIRVSCVVDLLKQVAVGGQRLTVSDLSPAVHILSIPRVLQKIARIDMGIRTTAWASTWNILIAAANECSGGDADAEAFLAKLDGILDDPSVVLDAIELNGVAKPTIVPKEDAPTGAVADGSEVVIPAADKTEGNNLMSINKLRAEWSLTDGTTVLIIGAFMKAAESMLWDAFMVPCSGKSSTQMSLTHLPFRPDVGLDKILMDGEKLVITETPDTRLTMNYVGTVSRVPTVTSLRLCVVFGEQLYVEGQSHKSSGGGSMLEAFVPAWSVPLASKKEGKQKKVQFLLKTEASVIPFEWTYLVGAKKRQVQTSLVINRLVLADGSATKVFGGTDRIPLARVHEDDPFPAKADLLMPPRPKKLEQNKASASSGEGNTSSPNKVDPKCAHMFR